MVSTTQGKSGAHSQSLKLNVTPASDVIALYSRPRYLRGSTRYVSTCGLITEAALCQLQGVPLEVTCRGEVAYSSEDGNVAPAREVILL